jgi:hypothetical protein
VTKRDRARFWSKVKIDPATGCWVWTASVRTWKAEPWDGGYPAFKVGGKVVRGHIFAYQILFGSLPPRGKVLLHDCDNRRCVNVLGHIKPDTQEKNVKDMLAKGRSIHQKRNATILLEIKDAKEEDGPGSPIESRPGSDGDLSVGAPVARDGSSVDRRDPGAPGAP